MSLPQPEAGVPRPWPDEAALRALPLTRRLQLQALAQHADRSSGPLQAVLRAKLAAHWQQAQALITPLPQALPQETADFVQPERPLRALLALLQPQAELPWQTPEGLPQAAPAELKTLQAFRANWQRLDTERRLQDALAPLPAQSGPLNTQRLLQQALLLMRQHSPGMLQHFVAQVDCLLWLETAETVHSSAARSPVRMAAKPGSKSAPVRRTAAARTRS